MTPLKIVFAGTPAFAATALAALLDTPHQLVAVYTQPDRPAGRGRKLKPGPVKQLALDHALPVFQPESLKSVAACDELQALQPDVMVVAAYGLLLPVAVLETPRHGCLNIHASLLPRWRGAAPIQRAILAGDIETGVTIMQMDEGLDTGGMLLKMACPIGPEDTASSLHDRLATLGAEAIVAALAQLDRLTPEQQDENAATYARKLSKQEAIIHWQEPAKVIDRQVRAFNPWPVAQTAIDGQTLRIWGAQPRLEPTDAPPGTVIATGKTGIDVACGEGILRLTYLQPPGGKPMDIQAFLNGRPDLLRPGMQLHATENVTPR
jgi:methionyl-tRNA formyltransferase